MAFLFGGPFHPVVSGSLLSRFVRTSKQGVNFKRLFNRSGSNHSAFYVYMYWVNREDIGCNVLKCACAALVGGA